MEDQKIYVALVTKNFSLYQDLTKELRERSVRFLTLSPDEDIPPDVDVVITSRNEAESIPFSKKVIASDPETSVNEALRLLHGTTTYERVIVGIDPGNEPGIAVVVEGRVTAIYRVPEAHVTDVVQKITRMYPSAVVKIGNGARLVGAHIANNLTARGMRVELVDESGTSPHLGKGTAGTVLSDIVAAINIALSQGTIIGHQEIAPSKGEIRIIQARSRELSAGKTTIPRKLAERVANGEMTIEEALAEHDGARGENDGS